MVAAHQDLPKMNLPKSESTMSLSETLSKLSIDGKISETGLKQLMEEAKELEKVQKDLDEEMQRIKQERDALRKQIDDKAENNEDENDNEYDRVISEPRNKGDSFSQTEQAKASGFRNDISMEYSRRFDTNEENLNGNIQQRETSNIGRRKSSRSSRDNDESD